MIDRLCRKMCHFFRFGSAGNAKKKPAAQKLPTNAVIAKHDRCGLAAFWIAAFDSAEDDFYRAGADTQIIAAYGAQ